MKLTFSDDLIIGVILGIAICWGVIYFMLQIMARFPEHWLSKLLVKFKPQPLPATPIKARRMNYANNLDKEKIHLDIQEVLRLLPYYQKDKHDEQLLSHIKEALHGHTAEGNNALLEYISHETAEVEAVEALLEIEPELLFEVNEHGDTALHVAVHHGHGEIAEFLCEEHHFANHQEWHDFLHHHNHEGHTALHDAAHLWHEFHLRWHFHVEHFVHMVEKHPEGSLFWKDREEKTVYEHFFEHKDANAKLLIDALIHKGVLHQVGDHLEISSKTRNTIIKESEENSHKLHALAELLVNRYPQMLHHHTAETPEVKTEVENKLRAKHIAPPL